MDSKNEHAGLMHTFSNTHDSTISLPKLLAVCIVFIILGIGTGYLVSKNHAAVKGVATVNNDTNAAVKGSVYGSDDTSTFKDSAEGLVSQGGIKGEGQYHLTRPGGDTQNVYMTSSIVDLSKFVGHKVKVWGQTQKAQTAGWLMDVGKVQVFE